MATKTCKQCGELKPESQFRKYYSGRKGTYNTCKLCEKINSREKYLAGKVANATVTDEEQLELDKIYKLWEFQMTLGLRPPRDPKGKETLLVESLDDMLARYGAQAAQVAEHQISRVGQTQFVPPELLKWLIEDLTEEPEYYQEEVYEGLISKYRPQVKIDTDTMLPVYDDTYREILQTILARFDEYEDTYYDKE